MKKILKNFFILLFEWIKIIVIALIIAIPIRTFIFQPFIVKGKSMLPTLSQNNYIIVDELTYRFREPKRFEIIIFKFPKDPSKYYVKRIIGLPNETVEIKNGKIFIYNSIFKEGFELKEKYNIIKNSHPKNLKIKLGENEYFVMGDNRAQSYDSRYWGPLPKNYIIGRAFLRIWPIDEVHAYFITDNF